MRPGEASAAVRWQALTIAVVAAARRHPRRAGRRPGAVAGDRRTDPRPARRRRARAPGRRCRGRCRAGSARPGHPPRPPSLAPAPRRDPAERVMGMAWMIGARRVAPALGLAGAARPPRHARRRGDDRRRRRRPPGRHCLPALRRRDRRAGRSRPTASATRRRGRRSRQPASDGVPTRPSAAPRRRPRRAHGRRRRRRDGGGRRLLLRHRRASAASRHRPFMVEGRMFDPDDPHEVVVNEAGCRGVRRRRRRPSRARHRRLGPARRVPRAESGVRRADRPARSR